MRTYAAYAAWMSAEKGQSSEDQRRSPRLCACAPVRLPHKTGCALLLTGRYAASSPHRTPIILPGYGKALIQRNFNGLLHSLRARQLDAPALGGEAGDAGGGGGARGRPLAQRRARPPRAEEDRRAALLPAPLGEEEAGGVGDVEHTVAGHLEDAHLVGRAEAVLDAAQQPIGVEALALQVEDGVYYVLQRARAGHRALLRHVPDDADRYVEAFRRLHQPQRALAHLA